LKVNNKSIYNDSVVLSNKFQYIKADRHGPRITTQKEDYVVTTQKSVGQFGEFTPYFMLVYGESKIADSILKHPRATSDSLRSNVEAWLGEVSPGVQIQYLEHAEIDQVSTSFSFLNRDGTSNDYRATNVGFGISYTLPIIVALLAASPGDLIVIENPEAHLHPKGQRKIGELISRASALGIQVIAETHSDHVLNGIRISIKEGFLAPDSAVFNYFYRNGQKDPSSSIATPPIDKNGRFAFWPEGFFDEWDIALEKLL
jgi:predicted ATPase